MEGISIMDGIDKMDFDKVTRMLSNAYWSPEIKIEEVKKGASNSASVVGALLQGQTQIGYARVISDKTRFAYILDMYVEGEYRKRGIGQRIIKHILSHNELKDVYIWLLNTKDAQGFYGKAGFRPISDPLGLMEIRKERPRR
jgi:GNAT superfamily N-acetyltransferase